MLSFSPVSPYALLIRSSQERNIVCRAVLLFSAQKPDPQITDTEANVTSWRKANGINIGQQLPRSCDEARTGAWELWRVDISREAQVLIGTHCLRSSKVWTKTSLLYSVNFQQHVQPPPPPEVQFSRMLDHFFSHLTLTWHSLLSHFLIGFRNSSCSNHCSIHPSLLPSIPVLINLFPYIRWSFYPSFRPSIPSSTPILFLSWISFSRGL